MTHAVFLLQDMMETEIIEEFETCPYSIPRDKILDTTIHPYAFLETDLIDAGGEIPEQFESRIDSTQGLLEVLEEPDHFCGEDILEDEEMSELEKDINAALLAHNLTRVHEPIGVEVELVNTETHLVGQVLVHGSVLQPVIYDSDLDPSVFALVAARGLAEMMIDPVFLGWRRSLRLISYLKTTKVVPMHKNHLIMDPSCIICEKGYSIVRATLKKTVLERFLDEDEIIYADGRLSAEFQFRTEEFDNVQFINKHEIVDRKPLVLADSPILYSYVIYLGVQVLQTILNRTVSTGDDMWGLRWDEIPDALQIYGIRDIKFGFIVYIVLAGILLRDLFPDPDVVCTYLKCEQEEAVNWFLDGSVLSLEGVEFHAHAEIITKTREELLYSLRFHDARDNLCSSPPKYIVLWTRLIGSWPSITHGGCRFLIQCREWFMVQIRILAGANIQWMDG